jgi:xylose dehydrogenase (NAD/NADP)
MDYWRLNSVGTIIMASGTLWFPGGRMASFDTGADAAHRCYYEVVASKGCVRVEDLTGGQGRSGNFNAYLDEFTGSGYYFVDDAAGKESRMEAPTCDHTALMIEDFSQLVLSGKPSEDWPRRSRATHATMIALMNSIAGGGSMVNL